MRYINELLYKFTARLPCRLIKLDSGPYLERYYVGKLFGVTFYLHRFVSPDTERHLHNHPWGWGRAIVLSGGYDEEVVTDLTTTTESGCMIKNRRIRFYNCVNGNHFHRIANAAPGTWTLFFHGRRTMIKCGMVSRPKGWGFLQHGYAVGAHDCVQYVPYPRASEPTWWVDAPTGENAGREPL